MACGTPTVVAQPSSWSVKLTGRGSSVGGAISSSISSLETCRAANGPAPVPTVTARSAQPRWKASCAAQRVALTHSAASPPSAFQ